MNRDSVDWRGYVPAVTKPFKEQGALDLPAARTLFEWMAEQGMHGFVVAGTTGEWFTLAAEESRRCFEPPEVDIVRHTLETTGYL